MPLLRRQADASRRFGSRRRDDLLRHDGALPLLGLVEGAAADQVLGDIAQAGGPQAVILRIFNVWGTGFPDSLATRSTGGAPEEELRFRGRSTFVRDYVYVDDAVRATHSAFDLDADEVEAVVYGGSGR